MIKKNVGLKKLLYYTKDSLDESTTDLEYLFGKMSILYNML